MSLEGKTPEEIEKLANFANTILTKARKETLHLAKKVDPTFTSPELEIDEKIEAATAKLNEQNAELTKQILAEKIERSRESKKAELKAAGYDIEAVEKVMTDNGISNYEGAVKLMKAEAVLAPSSPPSRESRMPTNFKDIQKNPTAWARDEAHKAVDELMRARTG
jgi:flagellar biosynthesis/type III secretory pathway protein FliH